MSRKRGFTARYAAAARRIGNATWGKWSTGGVRFAETGISGITESFLRIGIGTTDMSNATSKLFEFRTSG